MFIYLLSTSNGHASGHSWEIAAVGSMVLRGYMIVGYIPYWHTTFPDLPTFYEIKAEDLPPFGKKNTEDIFARKI